MSQSLHVNEQAHLRQAIISQCVWSDTYSSLKHILKRTANQLPLLVSFSNNNDDEQSSNNHDQTIFFFDRNVSSKILFTPLRQLENEQNQFEIYPRHCTFAATDLFKGAFEFVRDGQRCSRIFPTLEELVDFAKTQKCAVVFMSRDRVRGYYPDSDSSSWTNKQYSQGSLFRAERIHRSSEDRQHNNDYLECLDEDGYAVFLKMVYPGRFSLVATSTDQQENQPEIYLHSTQTPNISQLIKRLTLQNNDNNDNCIRLVRGSVPHNFHCQYLQLVRQHTYDILVGVTQEGLVIEWNLESHAPCRYATNLNDILYKLSDAWEEQLLETYIDQARSHYREDFQINMQLISTRDWGAFFQYWKWTGDIDQIEKHETNIPYQSRHRFHLVASIQDLSDDPDTLSTEFKKSVKHHHRSQSSNENHHHRPQSSKENHDHHRPRSSTENHHKSEKKLTVKQRLFLSQMNKLRSPSNPKPNRISLKNPRIPSLIITHGETPFDNSVYDSNPQTSSKISTIHLSKKNALRTQ